MGTFSSDSSEPPWELSVFFILTEEQFWQKKCSTFLASSIVRSTQGGRYLEPRGNIISSFHWRWHYYNFYSEPSQLYDSHQNKKEVYWDESSLLLVTDKVGFCGCLMTGCTYPTKTKNKKTTNKTFDGACTTSWKLHSRNSVNDTLKGGPYFFSDGRRTMCVQITPFCSETVWPHLPITCLFQPHMHCAYKFL